MVKTRSLCLTWHWIRSGSWRTDRRTDRQTEFPWLIRAWAVPGGTAVARKKYAGALRCIGSRLCASCCVDTATRCSRCWVAVVSARSSERSTTRHGVGSPSRSFAVKIGSDARHVTRSECSVYWPAPTQTDKVGYNNHHQFIWIKPNTNTTAMM